MERLLVINYRNMDVGGIENYVYYMIKQALRENYRIIWLCDINPKISPVYENLLNSVQVRKVYCNTHSFHWFTHSSLDLNKYDLIISISFNFMDHMRSLELLNGIDCKNIVPIYMVPHFKGGLIFPETNFKYLSSIIRSIISKYYQKFIFSGEMIYMSKDHPDAIERAYDIKIKDSLRTLAPDFNVRRCYNDKPFISNYRRRDFYIVSAGRIEFPHKGYLLGLIDEFCDLKRKYENLKLIIIGEGKDKKVLLEKLNNLTDYFAKDIIYKGNMSYENLLDFYQKCNLSVSVAGCAIASAKVGLLTLPCRHYTYKCEVYGFIPEAKEMITSEKPGKPVKEYIERVLKMSEVEYLSLSKASYDCYKDGNSSINDLCKHDSIKKYYPSKAELLIVKTIYLFEKINYYIKIF